MVEWWSGGVGCRGGPVCQPVMELWMRLCMRACPGFGEARGYVKYAAY